MNFLYNFVTYVVPQGILTEPEVEQVSGQKRRGACAHPEFWVLILHSRLGDAIALQTLCQQMVPVVIEVCSLGSLIAWRSVLLPPQTPVLWTLHLITNWNSDDLAQALHLMAVVSGLRFTIPSWKGKGNNLCQVMKSSSQFPGSWKALWGLAFPLTLKLVETQVIEMTHTLRKVNSAVERGFPWCLEKHCAFL